VVVELTWLVEPPARDELQVVAQLEDGSWWSLGLWAGGPSFTELAEAALLIRAAPDLEEGMRFEVRFGGTLAAHALVR